MTTVKSFLVAASCGLVLLGAVAVQAIGLGDSRGPNGPTCPESSDDVRGAVPCPPPIGFGEDREFGGPICLESPDVRVTRPCSPPEEN
jgi:hypothetical protein